MSKIGNYLVGKNEEIDDYMVSIGEKKSNNYTIDEMQEMSSSQYSEYFYRWMDENTND
jgi:hypothetical protein